jgi:hypothetical protein
VIKYNHTDVKWEITAEEFLAMMDCGTSEVPPHQPWSAFLESEGMVEESKMESIWMVDHEQQLWGRGVKDGVQDNR